MGLGLCGGTGQGSHSTCVLDRQGARQTAGAKRRRSRLGKAVASRAEWGLRRAAAKSKCAWPEVLRILLKCVRVACNACVCGVACAAVSSRQAPHTIFLTDRHPSEGATNNKRGSLVPGGMHVLQNPARKLASQRTGIPVQHVCASIKGAAAAAGVLRPL